MIKIRWRQRRSCVPWLGRFWAYLLVVTLFVVIVVVLVQFGLPWLFALGVPVTLSAAALRVIRVVAPVPAV